MGSLGHESGGVGHRVSTVSEGQPALDSGARPEDLPGTLPAHAQRNGVAMW